MLNFIIGVTVGAAFSKFWIGCYNAVKNWVIEKTK